MYIQRETITVDTDASGAAVVYTSARFTGEVRQIVYTKDDYDAGVDFNIQVEDTGETVWAESNVDASKTVAPRVATHSTAGVASLYAGSGLAVNDRIAVANSRIKITIASGGNVKSGEFDIIVGG